MANPIGKLFNENAELFKNSDAAKMAVGKRAIENGIGIYEAFNKQLQAQLESNNIQTAINEIEARTNIQVGNIHTQADKVLASQQAAYTKAGVTVSGSAMSVMSDTLNDAAEAIRVKQMEAGYELLGLAMKKGILDRKASSGALMSDILKTSIKSAVGLAGDFEGIKRKNSRNIGAAGIE